VGRNDGGSAGCQDRAHHHGELETVLYVVKGRVRMRWGDQLEFSEEPGLETLFTFHLTCRTREINASPDEICEAVVVRDGQDPIVVNLDLRTQNPPVRGVLACRFTPIAEQHPLRNCRSHVDRR